MGHFSVLLSACSDMRRAHTQRDPPGPPVSVGSGEDCPHLRTHASRHILVGNIMNMIAQCLSIRSEAKAE